MCENCEGENAKVGHVEDWDGICPDCGKPLAALPPGQYTSCALTGMCITAKLRFTVIGFQSGRNVVKPEGKRKAVYLNNEMISGERALVFKGWDIPLKADSETNHFSGNALLNFVGSDPEAARKFIKENNLNKKADLGMITFGEEDKPETQRMLFEEEAKLAAPGHAVIRRIMGC